MDKLYQALEQEMYSRRPNILRLALLTGAVEALRATQGLQVPEIELAYIRINEACLGWTVGREKGGMIGDLFSRGSIKANMDTAEPKGIYKVSDTRYNPNPRVLRYPSLGAVDDGGQI